MGPVRLLGRLAPPLLAVCLLAMACSNSSVPDDVAPACNGVSPANLAFEQTPAGQCPKTPTLLTGTGTVGSPCADATDCVAVCCTCPGGATGAAVAECSNGNCLDGSDECCLYQQQCAQ